MNSLGFEVASHKGSYGVLFGTPFDGIQNGLKEEEHLVIDAKVAELYSGVLSRPLQSKRVVMINATEANKSLEHIPDYIKQLTSNGIKRGHCLIAVGGGIVQDITAFIAATLFRGVSWTYYPTTLLAQADSCIGSKSSINVGGVKNQVGTFTPPKKILIATEILETLTDSDFRSGIGEMIKVHLISGIDDFNTICENYDNLRSNKDKLITTIKRSLEIKKNIIEKDEFDENERLILNYGHSFGHAIESATQYSVPHGIGVTIGMDMANFVSWRLGLIGKDVFDKIHPLLEKNFFGYEKTKVPMEAFFDAISKDKKNSGQNVSLILMRGPGKIFRDQYSNKEELWSLCEEYFCNWI